MRNRTPYINIVWIGLVIPFFANFVGGLWNGWDPLQYVTIRVLDRRVNWGGIVLIEFFNLVPIVAAMGVYGFYQAMGLRYPWVPVLLGYLVLAILHGILDLSSDAQAAVGVVVIPIYAAEFLVAAAGVYGGMTYCLEMFFSKK